MQTRVLYKVLHLRLTDDNDPQKYIWWKHNDFIIIQPCSSFDFRVCVRKVPIPLIPNTLLADLSVRARAPEETGGSLSVL